MNIDKFKRDHVTILSSIDNLRTLVRAGVEQNASEISRLIVSMSSTIKLHLAAEDRVLYPAFMKSGDPQVAEVGQRFQTEMSGIAGTYMKFAGKWNIGSKITADPEGFRKEANGVFKTIWQRMLRENKELYVVAESI